MKTLVTSTYDNNVFTPLGSFAAAYDLKIQEYEYPLLAVGIKLKIFFNFICQYFFPVFVTYTKITWLGGSVVKAINSQFAGREFKSLCQTKR
ncbi:hypothetical protein PGB90_009465 [Kerria lacca]